MMDGPSLDALRLAVDPAYGVGLLLSMIRVAAFVISSPVLGKSWPATARLGLVVALSLFLTHPVEGVTNIAPLVVAASTNAAIGLALGFLSGMIMYLFTVAGSLIDVTSGLAVAQVFDPSAGTMTSVYGKLFAQTAVALFVVLGGLHVLVRGLAGSVRLIPLDGRVAMDGELAEAAARTAGEVMYAGAELALPVLSSLIVAEVVLGLASRFAPQANVLLLGLPAKLLITMTVVGTVVLTLPTVVGGVTSDMASTMTGILRVLAG